jgi:stearoyl-CoA desaturase (delta-9 desaturase)
MQNVACARPGRQELAALKARQADAEVMVAARRWLHRDFDKVPGGACSQLGVGARRNHRARQDGGDARGIAPAVAEYLADSREQLAADLQAWCRRAEDSGIAALRDFSMRLRAARVPDGSEYGPG